MSNDSIVVSEQKFKELYNTSPYETVDSIMESLPSFADGKVFRIDNDLYQTYNSETDDHATFHKIVSEKDQYREEDDDQYYEADPEEDKELENFFNDEYGQEEEEDYGYEIDGMFMEP